MSIVLLGNRKLVAELSIWCTGLCLQALILARGSLAGLLRRYSLFYLAIACNFLVGAIALWPFLFTHVDLAAYYWDSEFLTAFVACGIVIEILHHSFETSTSRGTRYFARALRYAVYIAVLLFGLLFLGGHGGHASWAHLVSLERDFRLVQAALLLSLTAAVFYFGLPLGGNLKGMLVGYGLYIASNLATLTLKSRFPASFSGAWTFLQPLMYCASLVVYLRSLWSYSPSPKLEGVADIARQADGMLESVPERFRLSR